MKKKAILKLLLVMLFIASVMVLASCSKTFVVSFDADGGSAVNSVEVKSGEKLGSVPTTTKEGYTFDGWYNNNDKWNFEHYAVTKDVTLKAKWIKNHTVVFDSNGGSAVTGTVVLDGTKISAPTAPIKEGAEFLGWFAGEVQWNFEENAVTSDTTLVAKWREIFIVNFNSDAGNERIPSQSVKSGDLAVAPTAPTRLGYEFAGWYVFDSATNTLGDAWDFATPVNASLTLKAKWIPTYTVSFDSDGAGKIDPIKVTKDSLVPAPAEVSKDGYIFLGWYNGETLWDFATATVTADVKLVAKWSFITFGVTIDPANGSAPTVLDLAPYDKVPAQAAPTYQGYRFDGWYVFDAATNTYGEAWDFENDYIETAALVIKAKWVKLYTVELMVEGTLVGLHTVDVGSTIPAPETDPAIDGLVFNGWYNNGVLWDFASSTVTADTTLTAGFLTTHNVKFDLNGGTSDEATEFVLVYGDKITKPEDPTREGYVFAGWLDQNGSAWDFNTAISSSVTLTAKWAEVIPVEYVELIPNLPYPNKLSESTVAIGATLAPYEHPKYGYTFDHWETANGKVWDFATDVVTEDLIDIATGKFLLYAVYEDNYWEISFDTNGANESSLNKVKIQKGDTVSAYKDATGRYFPANLTKELYAFDGWAYNDGSAFSENDKINGNITLTAKWADRFWTITYIIDGKTVKVQNVPFGKSATEPDDEEFTGGTNKLSNWTDINGNEWSFEENTYNEVTNINLYAILIEAHTVIFKNGDGETIKTIVVETGNKISSSDVPKSPSKDGFVFIGWCDENGNAWDFDSRVESNLVLKATLVEGFTAFFDADGPYHIQTVAKGDKFTEPKAPTKAGYEFIGWIADGAKEFWDFNTASTGNLNLHAIWKVKYTVSFDFGDGNVTTQEVVEGKLATKPADPTKDYNTFGGWLLNGNEFDFNTPIESNVTLTAKWIAIKYTVTFDANNGTAATSQEFEAGKPIIAPEVSKYGYVLKGWQFNGTLWDFNAPLTGNMTLVAVWTNEKVTISFELAGGSWNGGAKVPAQTVDYGSLLTKIDDPYMIDISFKGWYRPDGTKWNFDTDTATESLTLTARWDNTYTVVFKNDDGTVYETKEVPVGTLTVPPLIAPEKYGYKFLGWYIDENTAWNFTEMTVNSDMILTAKWELQVFTVTFYNPNKINPDGTVEYESYTQSVIYGDKIQLPEQPTSYLGSNLQFDGWSVTPNASERWNFATDIVTGNVTLYARWVSHGNSSDGGTTGPWDENTNVQGPLHTINP